MNQVDVCMVFLGEVLNDSQYGFLVVFVVDHLNIVSLDVHHFNVINSRINLLFGEVLNDGQGGFVFVRIVLDRIWDFSMFT